MHKTYLLRILAILSAISAYPACVLGQSIELQEDLPQKPDLKDLDAITMPPMDPYSLSFVPPMPEGAQDIRSKTACEKIGGTWQKTNIALLNIEIPSAYLFGTPIKDENPAYGCLLEGKKIGLWMKGYDVMADTQTDDITGYTWCIDDNPEGWMVNLKAPKLQVIRLSQVSKGVQEGTTFEWNPTGVLTSVSSLKDGKYHGKFEQYQDCLPMLLGAYDHGKPTGTWELYEDPGFILAKRHYDRKASLKELPKGASKSTEAYWTEWFNTEGIKIAEGYSVSDAPTELGYKIGDIQFYSTKGNPWITVHYDHEGKIDDAETFKNCTPEAESRVRIPAYLDYDHEKLVVSCKNAEGTLYREIYFYATGEKWRTVDVTFNNTSGWIFEYHPTGELLTSYKAKNDIPEGTIRYLKRNGEPMAAPNTLRDGNGLFQAYWHNGHLREEGKFVNYKKEGKWTTWFDNGTRQTETDYTGNKKDGFYREWYVNGVLAIQIAYSNDQRQGDLLAYYTDGRLAAKYQWSQDMPKDTAYDYAHSGSIDYETHYNSISDIEQKRYFNNGALQSSGKITPGMGRGTRKGKWDFYLKETGDVWYSTEFQYGSATTDAAQVCDTHGGEFVIDSNTREVGCQVCTVNRKAPRNPTQIREGQWEWYTEQGKLEKRGAIHLGHLNGEWEYYYPDGTTMLNGSYEIDQKVGEWKGYFKNGSPKFQGQYKQGLEQGEWQTFHENTNRIASKGQFVDGKREGQWTWYHANGAIREQGAFEKGKEVGVWTQYYDNGNKNGEGTYVQGIREGLWTWWRQDGSVWRTANYVKGKEKQ